MRRYFIAGNWKMNLNLEHSNNLFQMFSDASQNYKNIDILIAAPFVYLSNLAAKKSPIKLAAQNYHKNESGAFTGEISIPMLLDLNIDYSIVGHSERRQYYNETDLVLAEKLKEAVSKEFFSILCIGETLEERESGKTLEIIKYQLETCLKYVDIDNMKYISIAYEPVWAIGTGKTASPEQAEEVHSYIRSFLSERYTDSCSENCRILYGGSMNKSNAEELLKQKNIDGGLIGGASLKNDFIDIIETANKLS